MVPARWAAVKAGIGKFGRNNFIYAPEHGSYIEVHTWIVDKELDYDATTEEARLSECGDDCNKCIQACPTNAFAGAYSMDMGRCVAYLSYRSKSVPDVRTRRQMGEWIYGCDVCQDVCPLNKDKLTEAEEFPLLSQFEEYLTPENVLAMDEETYQNIIDPRFWYTGKDGLWLWKCNALRSMINSGNTEYHNLIKKYCNHSDTRLSEIAKQGCEELGI